MKIRRVMIAAPKSGSGKTTITCGLLQLLKNRKEPVRACKCGPDYIDPMFHEKILGIPSKNLDTFFTGEEKTRELFQKGRSENEFVVLEGVMGLYDGLGGIREEGSSYHLAKVTKTPIILVVDAKGMGRSLIPLIAGFLSYDVEHLIRGVILNRMSAMYYQTIKPLLEEELPVQVIGYLPEERDCKLGSRHLGLVMPEEVPNLQMQMQQMARNMEGTLNISEILAIADAAGELEDCKQEKGAKNRLKRDEKAPVIAVAKDEAFCFYYQDNLDLLKAYGAEIRYFSPLWDSELPKECDGILLGGGYPELYAKELSANIRMKESIRTAFERKMPMVAECGGFLYLHQELQDKEKNSFPMVGILPYQAHDTGKLVRFGYIELQEKDGHFLDPEERIRGHEFHYYDSEENGGSCVAKKPVTGRTYPCIVEGESYFLGFPHLCYASNPHFAEAFVKKATRYHRMNCQSE